MASIVCILVFSSLGVELVGATQAPNWKITLMVVGRLGIPKHLDDATVSAEVYRSHGGSVRLRSLATKSCDMGRLVLKKDDFVCAGDNEGILVALPSGRCRCDFGRSQKQTEVSFEDDSVSLNSEAITLEAISMRGRRGDRWPSW